MPPVIRTRNSGAKLWLVYCLKLQLVELWHLTFESLALHRFSFLADSPHFFDLGDRVRRQGDLACRVSHFNFHGANFLCRGFGLLEQRFDVSSGSDHKSVHGIADSIW